MSRILRVAVRDRWAAKRMILVRWLAQGHFGPQQPICEVDIDGSQQVFHEQALGTGLHPEDYGGIYHYFVAEGNEIGPWGELLEYTDSGTPEWKRATLHATALRPLIRRERYPRVFLSYRHEDSEAYAWRLHGDLTKAFGREEVFLAPFSIKGGDIFPWVIQQAVVHSEVVVALMGPRWGGSMDRDGKIRLNHPLDYLRRELTAALDRGIPIIPVLLPGGSLPERNSLSQFDMDGLDQYQAFPLSPRHWDTDVAELVEDVSRYVQGR